MEYVLGSLWFWLGAVAVVGIVGGVLTTAITRSNETRRHLADAANGGDYQRLAEEFARRQQRVSEQLDELDDRLARIEKTLTDIPG